jgi:hypothetical protein
VNSGDKKNVLQIVTEHPTVAFFVAFVALAIAFSPKASTLASWICLCVAFFSGIAFLLGMFSGGAKRFVAVSVLGVGVVLLGFWLTDGKKDLDSAWNGWRLRNVWVEAPKAERLPPAPPVAHVEPLHKFARTKQQSGLPSRVGAETEEQKRAFVEKAAVDCLQNHDGITPGMYSGLEPLPPDCEDHINKVLLRNAKPYRFVNGRILDQPKANESNIAQNGDNNIAQIGNNNQAMINNFGPAPPHVSWSLAQQPTDRNARHTWVKLTIDRTFQDAKFAVVCDRPCVGCPEISSGVTSPHGGYSQTDWGPVGNRQDVVGFIVNGPNPMPHDAWFMACVESRGTEPVHILQAQRLILTGD